MPAGGDQAALPPAGRPPLQARVAPVGHQLHSGFLPLMSTNLTRPMRKPCAISGITCGGQPKSSGL